MYLNEAPMLYANGGKGEAFPGTVNPVDWQNARWRNDQPGVQSINHLPWLEKVWSGALPSLQIWDKNSQMENEGDRRALGLKPFGLGAVTPPAAPIAPAKINWLAVAALAAGAYLLLKKG